MKECRNMEQPTIVNPKPHRLFGHLITRLRSSNVIIALLAGLLTIQVVQNQLIIRRATIHTSEETFIGEQLTLPTLLTIDGKSYSFPRDMHTRTLLIYFDTACQFCHRDVSLWKLLHHNAPLHGVIVVGVTRERDTEVVSRFVQAYQLPFPILMDPDRKLVGQLGTVGTPTKVLLAPDARVDFIWRGLTTQQSSDMALGALRMMFGIEPQQLPAASDIRS
ncbi:TlpA disulfide reductase family protein [Kallotenue papyrolyticum]|uniref:TlpA family protein disulfide reductase n=1 Tax=Kallotenue papyrolyticum TaxID=1325125 RepID=UPI0009E01C37